MNMENKKTMMIEVPVRWLEVVTDPDTLEEIKTRRIIYGDDEESSAAQNVRFTYDYMTLDLGDIKLFHRYDDAHFILKTYDGDSYCVHLPYEGFKDMYQDMLGINITQLRPMPSITIEDEDDISSN